MTSQHTNQLLALRPIILTEPAESVAEKFQNQTLRPILKLQNGLLLKAFRNYVKKHKNVFEKLSPQEREKYITHALTQDLIFRHFIRGIIAGHFTHDEWTIFEIHEEEINKRMIALAKQRLISQIMEI